MTTGGVRAPLAYGFLRCDRSGAHTSEHVNEIRRLAAHLAFDLRGVRVTDTDTEFARLLVTFAPSGITCLLVPHIVHLTGWMDAARRDVDVWSLKPLGRWPREGTKSRSAFLPGSGCSR